MIECTTPDDHFPEVPTWGTATGICLLCYTPALDPSTRPKEPMIEAIAAYFGWRGKGRKR